MAELEPELDFAPTEEMALNHIDKEWIALTIRESIRDHYRSKLARFRDWFPVTAAIAIVIFALTQWNAYTVFRVHTEDRLANIEGRELKAEAQHSPAAVLKEIRNLPPK